MILHTDAWTGKKEWVSLPEFLARRGKRSIVGYHFDASKCTQELDGAVHVHAISIARLRCIPHTILVTVEAYESAERVADSWNAAGRTYKGD